MSKNAFGLNPAPIMPGVTQAYTNPVIPAPAVSPQSTQMNNAGQINPILEAAAGPKCNIEWVDGLEQVLNHPTSPNEEMYFQDKNEPIIYRRETDGNGNIKNPIHILRFTVEEMPFGPEAQFVTKDEHRQLYELVEKLAGNIESMNGKLEQLLNG